MRRLTAANRSDATLGTEFVQDDGTPSYNGKVEMMEWKYVGKGTALNARSLVGRIRRTDDYVAHITYEAQPLDQPLRSARARRLPAALQEDDLRLSGKPAAVRLVVGDEHPVGPGAGVYH